MYSQKWHATVHPMLLCPATMFENKVCVKEEKSLVMFKMLSYRQNHITLLRLDWMWRLLHPVQPCSRKFRFRLPFGLMHIGIALHDNACKSEELRCKIQIVCCWIYPGELERGSRETVQQKQRHELRLAQSHKYAAVNVANKKCRPQEEGIARASSVHSSHQKCVFS